jgi:hypothetical protein
MADRLSKVFAALADPIRRDIVARLATEDATVGELAAPYDVSMQAVCDCEPSGAEVVPPAPRPRPGPIAVLRSSAFCSSDFMSRPRGRPFHTHPGTPGR